MHPKTVNILDENYVDDYTSSPRGLLEQSPETIEERQKGNTPITYQDPNKSDD